MFDLIAKPNVRPLQERSLGSRITAVLVHAMALTAVLALPAFHVVSTRPEVPTILTFVATPLTLSALVPLDAPSAPETPAPAHSAAPAPPPQRPEVATPKPVDSVPERPAPVQATADIPPEPVNTGAVDKVASLEGRDAGIGGGGGEGTAGGLSGGLVGGDATPPPPPPPKPTAPAKPVRVGGPVKIPGLIKRVEPVYSDVAAAGELTGFVLIEAGVDINGSVDSIKMLHSAGAILDGAAIDALKQWKYSPLILNGVPTPFLVTVTFNFRQR
jgi:protein TonB